MPVKAETQLIKLYDDEVIIEFYPASHRYKLIKDGDKVIEPNHWLISVTGATSMIDKSAQLLAWAERLTNEYVGAWLDENVKIIKPDKYKSGTRAIGDTSEQVTEIISTLIKEAASQYRLEKERAKGVGDIVHDFAHQFALWKTGLMERPEIGDWPDQARNGINGFLDWYKDHDVVFKAIEQIVYSRSYNYVGKFDAIVEVGGKSMVIDYKTGKGIYNEHLYQLAAYWEACSEEKGLIIDGGLILHFDKVTGRFGVIEISAADNIRNFDGFLACLKLKQLNAKSTPSKTKAPSANE